MDFEQQKSQIREMFYVTDMGNRSWRAGEELQLFLGHRFEKCLGVGFGKKIFPVFLLLIRWFLWFAADVFFYIAERFFRRRIWEIAGTKVFERGWKRLGWGGN